MVSHQIIYLQCYRYQSSSHRKDPCSTTSITHNERLSSIDLGCFLQYCFRHLGKVLFIYNSSVLVYVTGTPYANIFKTAASKNKYNRPFLNYIQFSKIATQGLVLNCNVMSKLALRID